MALTLTYTTLKTQLQRHLGDTGTPLSDQLDTIIGLGELKCLRDIDLEIFDAVDDAITFTASTSLVTKPTGYVATRLLRTSASAQPLLPRSREYLIDYWPDLTQTGTTLFYADLNETQWRVVPTPSATSVGSCTFIKRPTGLSGTADTTWLSTNVADLLLSACLCSAERFIQADERLPLWNETYTAQLTAAKFEFRGLIRKDFATEAAMPSPQGAK